MSSALRLAVHNMVCLESASFLSSPSSELKKYKHGVHGKLHVDLGFESRLLGTRMDTRCDDDGDYEEYFFDAGPSTTERFDMESYREHGWMGVFCGRKWGRATTRILTEAISISMN